MSIGKPFVALVQSLPNKISLASLTLEKQQSNDVVTLVRANYVIRYTYFLIRPKKTFKSR